MSKYFDKDFFRFFLGFAAIVSVSLMIIVATRMYQERSASQTANVIDAAGSND